MMAVWSLSVVLAMVGVVILGAHQPVSAELVGLVKRVKSGAYGTPPGAEREKKFVRFPVVQDELLETDDAAAMLVEFVDRTVLTLGPSASLVVDTMVYDPESQNVTAVLKLSVGMLRFVSGKFRYADMKIVTPTAVIGIRGSDAVVIVSKEGATKVDVFEGEFTVSNRDGSEQATVGPAQSVSVSAVGAVGPVGPAPADPPDELGFAPPSGPGVDPGTGEGGEGPGTPASYNPSKGLAGDHPDDDHHDDDDDDDDDDHHHDDDDDEDDGHPGGDESGANGGGDNGGH